MNVIPLLLPSACFLCRISLSCLVKIERYISTEIKRRSWCSCVNIEKQWHGETYKKDGGLMGRWKSIKISKCFIEIPSDNRIPILFNPFRPNVLISFSACHYCYWHRASAPVTPYPFPVRQWSRPDSVIPNVYLRTEWKQLLNVLLNFFKFWTLQQNILNVDLFPVGIYLFKFHNGKPDQWVKSVQN